MAASHSKHLNNERNVHVITHSSSPHSWQGRGGRRQGRGCRRQCVGEDAVVDVGANGGVGVAFGVDGDEGAGPDEEGGQCLSEREGSVHVLIEGAKPEEGRVDEGDEHGVGDGVDDCGDEGAMVNDNRDTEAGGKAPAGHVRRGTRST